MPLKEKETSSVSIGNAQFDLSILSQDAELEKSETICEKKIEINRKIPDVYY